MFYTIAPCVSLSSTILPAERTTGRPPRAGPSPKDTAGSVRRQGGERRAHAAVVSASIRAHISSQSASTRASDSW